jgi:hypothetical protein
MNKSYVIQWTSNVNGRAGRGTKRFDKDEAERLVEELNREYPQIEHQIVPANDTAPKEPAETVIPNVSTPILSLA